MAYTLGEAAKATGKSKTSIRRALDKGRVSGTKNDSGEWVIDPAELHRVFAMVEPRNSDAEAEAARSVTPDGTPVTAILQARLEAAEARIADRDAVIDDLRRRLDAEAEERRRLTALLTDQRPRPEPVPVPEQPLPSPQKPVEGRLARAWSILRGRA
jgi:hypothetical protein